MASEIREMQYDVHFVGLRPAIERAGEFAQYHLSKVALGSILSNWPFSARWIAKSPARRKAGGGYHPTAISRSKISAPLREYLARVGPANGRVLYHGVGRDEIGAQALQMRGQVTRFDPHHPNAEVRRDPSGPFDEIHSHYTLNVTGSVIGHDILLAIHAVLSENGAAVVTVRRDLDRRRNAK